MTPDVATSWLDIVNAGGTVFVLGAIIVYAAKMLPTFLLRWKEHTEVLMKIDNRLTSLEDELKELKK